MNDIQKPILPKYPSIESFARPSFIDPMDENYPFRYLLANPGEKVSIRLVHQGHLYGVVRVIVGPYDIKKRPSPSDPPTMEILIEDKAATGPMVCFTPWFPVLSGDQKEENVIIVYLPLGAVEVHAKREK